MSVKNFEKAGLVKSPIRRKVFVGDIASMYTPETNPEPSTARGRRRIQVGKAKPAARPQLLVGLAKRKHTYPRDLRPNMGAHLVDDSHSRFVSLIHGRRVYHD